MSAVWKTAWLAGVAKALWRKSLPALLGHSDVGWQALILGFPATFAGKSTSNFAALPCSGLEPLRRRRLQAILAACQRGSNPLSAAGHLSIFPGVPRGNDFQRLPHTPAIEGGKLAESDRRVPERDGNHV